MIITIDGPVATGKSTIAKNLAAAVGYIYFDTGAMYRAFTLGVIRSKVDLKDADALKKFMEDFSFEIKIKRGERRYFIGEDDVSDLIRQDEVTSLVSEVSANLMVREFFLKFQRELGGGVNAVFEGRDMGSAVFPDAQIKIFLTGRPEVRAKRRYDELMTKYPEQNKGLTLEKVLKDLIARDAYDSTREHSPLKKADDAFELDTSDLSIEEIIFKILEYKDTLKTRQSTKDNV